MLCSNLSGKYLKSRCCHLSLMNCKLPDHVQIDISTWTGSQTTCKLTILCQGRGKYGVISNLGILQCFLHTLCYGDAVMFLKIRRKLKCCYYVTFEIFSHRFYFSGSLWCKKPWTSIISYCNSLNYIYLATVKLN